MKPVDGRWTLVATALVCLWLWPSDALAQAEHAPDNYKMSNATAISADPAAKTDFQGTFALAQDVQCAGHKLTAGKYIIVVKTMSDGKMVTLEREGSNIVLMVRKTGPPTDSTHSAVLVRRGPGPGGHTLEAVYIESMKLMLFLDESGCTKQIDKMFATIKQTPIN